VLGGTEYAGSHLPLGEKRFADAFGKVFYNYPDGSRLFVEYFSLEGRRTLDLSQDFTIVPDRYWKIDPWQEQFANLVYSKALSEDATLDFVTYQRNRDFTTNQYTSSAFSVVSQDWLESQDDRGVDLRYSLRRSDGAMTRVGLQWSNLQTDTLQTQYRGPSGPLPKPKVTDVSQDRSTFSGFVNHVVPLRDNLRASVGARYDNMNDFSPDLTFAGGVEANLSPKTTWHLNLGTGAEHPEPTAGDVGENIVPPKATSVSAETGWTVRPDESQAWTITLFWAKTRDARVLYNWPAGSIGPLAFISKAEDLTTSGLELIYNRRVSDRLSWFANYLYLREEVTNHNPPAIPGPLYPFAPEPPTHVLAAGVRADVGETRLALSAKYASEHYEQSRLMKTAAPVDSSLVFDLTARRSVGRGEITAAISNLLDTDYETMPAFPRPGRNYLVSYRTEF
jgi:outer membrane cobalamin receptor